MVALYRGTMLGSMPSISCRRSHTASVFRVLSRTLLETCETHTHTHTHTHTVKSRPENGFKVQSEPVRRNSSVLRTDWETDWEAEVNKCSHSQTHQTCVPLLLYTVHKTNHTVLLCIAHTPKGSESTPCDPPDLRHQ